MTSRLLLNNELEEYTSDVDNLDVDPEDLTEYCTTRIFQCLSKPKCQLSKDVECSICLHLLEGSPAWTPREK